MTPEQVMAIIEATCEEVPRPLREFDADDLDDVLDALSAHGEECNTSVFREYRAARQQAIALAPELLSGGVDHPMTLLDEAVMALAVIAWDQGLKLGARLASAA